MLCVDMLNAPSINVHGKFYGQNSEFCDISHQASLQGVNYLLNNTGSSICAFIEYLCHLTHFFVLSTSMSCPRGFPSALLNSDKT